MSLSSTVLHFLYFNILQLAFGAFFLKGIYKASREHRTMVDDGIRIHDLTRTDRMLRVFLCLKLVTAEYCIFIVMKNVVV